MAEVLFDPSTKASRRRVQLKAAAPADLGAEGLLRRSAECVELSVPPGLRAASAIVAMTLLITAAAGVLAGLRLPAIGALPALLVALAALLLLVGGENGLTSIWRFRSGAVEREFSPRAAAAVWATTFPEGAECVIRHEVYKAGIFRMSQAGHSDTLTFKVLPLGRRVPIRQRSVGWDDSSAKLRGDQFTQAHATEIEAEIHSEILHLAHVAASTVGVPLYVSQSESWVGPSKDPSD